MPRRKSVGRGGRGKLRAAELKKFKDLLLAYRQKLTSTIEGMEDEALNKNRTEASGNLAVMPEMLDIASDNYAQEFTIGLIQNQNEELKLIDDALAKIEKGEFGPCEDCAKPIRKSRLLALPYARLCIECQDREEQHT